ncbi:hypothetical protein pdam_00011391, partial [Pocillopora damicornis]
YNLASLSSIIMVYFTNYSKGYVVEYETPCFKSWLLLPAENLWSDGVRGFLYTVAMFYIFLGIAIIADIFMSSIEVITSKKRKVTRYDSEKQERVEIEVFVWNETVANLTLMALGSSAPEILLAVVETVQNLGNVPDASQEDKDGLGTFTIIGSASFNLLLITALCVVSVPSGTVKKIREFGVFIVTSVWSLFAYVWLLVVLKWSSPDEIELWEAFVTLSFFPLLVITSWCQDNGWWCKRGRIISVESPEVRVIGLTEPGSPMMTHRSMELRALEQQRFSFRHAALRSITRQKPGIKEPVKDQEEQLNMLSKSLYGSRVFGGDEKTFSFSSASYSVVKSAKKLTIEVQLSQRIARSPCVPRKKLQLSAPYDPSTPIVNGKWEQLAIPIIKADFPESNGVPLSNPKINGDLPARESVYNIRDAVSTENNSEFQLSEDSAQSQATTFYVDYETRDGSAKHGKDYHNLKGTLTFCPGETKKTLTITIVHHDGYALEKDFYILLKNPVGTAELGEPNLARITIIDDDEPGEFSFEKASYYANVVTGDVSCTIIRRKGCDGTVTLTYNTMNGTGSGGTEQELEQKRCDYEQAVGGKLYFQHGETSKQLIIRVNPDCKNKNFIVLLSDKSPGAKIGQKSAAVINITNVDVDNCLLFFCLFRNCCGGWPAFFMSLLVIAGLTALVEQLGKLLGCAIGLKNSVTGITIIAIGTSLPDTFASRSAALQDIGADASIGNITGSNSVNVFLGLGLPWVISTCYHAVKKTKYIVYSGNLTFSVLVFTTFGLICLATLVIRRMIFGGELGGPATSKHMTGFFLVFLWCCYVVVSALVAYDIIPVGL